MHIQTDFGGNSLETRDMLKQCPPTLSVYGLKLGTAKIKKCNPIKISKFPFYASSFFLLKMQMSIYLLIKAN